MNRTTLAFGLAALFVVPLAACGPSGGGGGGANTAASSAPAAAPTELTDAQKKALAASLRTALGKDPEIETKVDPAILGGLKVRVGSRLYDASLKSRLDSLKFALKRA